MNADALHAHTPNADGDWHDLGKHVESVAELAETFSEPFGGAAHGRAVGLLHDLGKANPLFQRYLDLCHREPDRKHQTLDHKGAGTLAIRGIAPGNQSLVFAIAGHHGGLQDKEELGEKLREWKHKTPPNLSVPGVPAPPDTTELAFPGWVGKDWANQELFTRLLFSALVDADALDTERHGTPGASELRTTERPAISDLADRMTAAQHAIAGGSETVVQRVRDELAASCLAAASMPPGLFRLTAPTGSGKTRSALSFALEHARHNGLRRVISV
ncbi:MAG: CRISPR-associated endonuclease Cas3'', partial [Thermomicrobiales bacterium]